MIIRSVQFEKGAVSPAGWVAPNLPEFAFLGRSNVGKSTLLNALLGRKSVAHVSGRPGKTREINFFRVNDALRFVDLPGYGYAAVSETQRRQFRRMIETYVQEREPLLRVFHLIDVRHDPTEEDQRVHAWLLALGKVVCVVATKADKLGRTKVQAQVERIRKILQTPWPVIPTSGEKREGMDALWQLVEADIETLWREA
ncbi:MAG: YihA family ribosome biogenesis GTP-binding protein [Thermoflavifilum sp.]|nr:YihA family ribosome biogenesis GTP-binding protein [Thermoflavifilum sp.]MCL6514485.1 ribosome biogenesis GTP-binding protein YihA/YsxC [Alicyclobacillus sp.]